MIRQKNVKMITATKYNTPVLYLRIWLMVSTSGSLVINSVIMIIVACIRNTYESIPFRKKKRKPVKLRTRILNKISKKKRKEYLHKMESQRQIENGR